MGQGMTRKEFLKSVGMAGASLLLCGSQGHALWPGKYDKGKSVKGRIFKKDAPSKPWKWSIEAFHYTSSSRQVQCQVCPNRCTLSPGDRSICRSKVNIGGKLYSLAYGNPCSVNVDPIEKKPLNHFYPGTSILSIATTGCNFRCLNCQNWEISQRKPEEVRHTELFPADVVKAAKGEKTPSIAFTYSEAITYYEYTHDTAKLAGEALGAQTGGGTDAAGPLVRPVRGDGGAAAAAHGQRADSRVGAGAWSAGRAAAEGFAGGPSCRGSTNTQRCTGAGETVDGLAVIVI